MEEESTRRARKNELKKIILEAVKLAGIVSVAVVAPNVVGAMVKLGLIRSPRQRDVIERSCVRLARSGLLKRNEAGLLRLTPKGVTALHVLEAHHATLRKPRRWDHKWRVLIFDIPEYRKGLRDKVRRMLQAIGFVLLQESVWAYPYDCEDLITLLKADLHIGKAMLYMIVDSIEGDWSLRKRFALPAN